MPCSFLVGIGVVGFSGLNPLDIPRLASGWAGLTTPQNWLSWILSGLLVSGGSAFWNHALDLVQATKVQKELAVNATLPPARKFRHKPWRVWPEIGSTVFAVEEVAHGAAAGGVDFELGTALCVVGGAARLGLGGILQARCRRGSDWRSRACRDGARTPRGK
jgi:hypothetical protein